MTAQTDIAISVRGLGKRYRRNPRATSADSVRDLVADGVKGMFAGKKKRGGPEDFWALSDATFDIRKGENVGIIGLNGAGKSTLLKLLSRIVTPTTGEARITGSLRALLEVGTGFHQELTGRENTYLYGAILGMSHADVARQFDAIVDFSEIGDFIDTPVKRYSSGMYVRLAFAVAAHLDPDILLLDEVLAVGDLAFQRKCMNFARSLEQKGSTILFVSHNMFSIKTMCERVIYLKQGRIVFDGPTDEGLRLYETDSKLSEATWFKPEAEQPKISITNVRLRNEAGEETAMFEFGQRMRIEIAYRAHEKVERPDFRVGINRSDEVHCSTFSTTADGLEIPFVHGDGVIELTTPPVTLVADLYTATVSVRERGFGRTLCAQIGGHFHVKHPVFAQNGFGVYHESGAWKIDAARPETPA